MSIKMQDNEFFNHAPVRRSVRHGSFHAFMIK
jgi:hypothetical protein